MKFVTIAIHQTEAGDIEVKLMDDNNEFEPTETETRASLLLGVLLCETLKQIGCVRRDSH